ncbi:MAG: hypothetical protein JWO65_1937 [Sphingomonas bacterium]|jgi:hypothetical protein|nr:hypothetical protein [Sphingomonas bacterium]
MTGDLPQGFADLSPFLATWGALETQEERYLVRQNSRMDELRRFYEALVPRIGAALDHLDSFPVDAPLPAPELALYRLTLGLTEAAAAVEIYGRPEVPSVPRPHHVATSWSDGTG